MRNHFSSRLYNGLKRPLFRTADRKLYSHKWIYCAVFIPPVSIGLKKSSFKIELLSWLIQNNFPLWGKVFITESGPNRRSRVFQNPHLTAKALEEPVFGCHLRLHSEERCLFSEACLMGARPWNTIPSLLFSAVGLHILQSPPRAHTRFPERWAWLENTLFYVRRSRDRQLDLAAELHLQTREGKGGMWGGVPGGMLPLPPGPLLLAQLFPGESPHQHLFKKRCLRCWWGHEFRGRTAS